MTLDSTTRPRFEVAVHAGSARLEGILTLPESAAGLVLFAHGSGSSRLSPRNQFVAGVLNDGGLATLLFDLLTPEEDAIDRVTRELRFDIGLLAARLTGAIDWAGSHGATRHLKLGLFGASTGAAAALIAAARRPEVVRAVVSRGGRPDLAGDFLPRVKAPVLLIVGGNDGEVIRLNEAARRRLRAKAMLEIVPGASHLFEEPGTLQQAANIARQWFLHQLAPSSDDREHPEG
jgi:dienelactone hydrolase